MRNPVKIEVYTDGSAKNNGQEDAYGGWAYLILKDGQLIHKDCGSARNTTNQRMEMIAVIEACKYVSWLYELTILDSFIIYSDSAYVVNCANDCWYLKWQNNDWITSKGTSVINKDLWEQLIPYFEDLHFIFKKVKGHADNEYNNMVDEMAQKAAETRRYYENKNHQI